MGFDSGSGFLPDNVTLETNISGEAQIKDDGINTVMLKDDSVTSDKVDATSLQKWELLDTLTYSAEITKTSSTLAVFDEYLVLLNLTPVNSGNLLLRINEISSAVYDYRFIDNITITQATTQTSILLRQHVVQQGHLTGSIICAGLSGAGANSKSTITGFLPALTSVDYLLNGMVDFGTQTQLSKITIFDSAQNLTGTVKIYGRNI